MQLESMKYVNFNNKTENLIGAHFSYNKNLEQDKKLSKHIAKIENILKLWHMRQLTVSKVFSKVLFSKGLQIFSCF